MQVVDCSRCRKSRLCPQAGHQHLQVIFAFLDGRDADDCRMFEPDYLRGVDGVFLVSPQSRQGRV